MFNYEKFKKYMSTPTKVMNYAEHTAYSQTNYCRYLEYIDGEVMIRTFAYKLKGKKRTFLFTEVERMFIGREYAIQKNVYLTAMSGYNVVFEPQDKQSGSWYGYSYYNFTKEDFGKWFINKPMSEHGILLNVEDLFKIDKYKYCGFSGRNTLKEYLEAYEKDPSVEFFGKLKIKYSKMLGARAKKDKQFRKFIARNVKDVNWYGYRVTTYAFDHNVSFDEASKFLSLKREANKGFKHMSNVDYEVDRIKIQDWFFNTVNNKSLYVAYKNGERRLGWNNYVDYWNACVALGLDMRDTKNSMPKDFNRMHDIRIDEYRSHKAAIDEQNNKKFNASIKKVAATYSIPIEDETYTVRLPQNRTEFEYEGDALHHCVGVMGYDQKVVDGKIIIAFIRLKKDPDMPLYTVEYDLKSKSILQMHGMNNCSPTEEGRNFIQRWAEKVKGVQNGKIAVHS